MFPVHLFFIVDSGDIPHQLLFRVAVAAMLFGYSEMPDIGRPAALLHAEIGRIGFVRIENRIRADRFILVFYLIHIPKIGNPHLLHRPQDFIVRCLRFQSLPVDYAPDVFVQIAFQRRTVRLGCGLEIFVEFLTFVGRGENGRIARLEEPVEIGFLRFETTRDISLVVFPDGRRPRCQVGNFIEYRPETVDSVAIETMFGDILVQQVRPDKCRIELRQITILLDKLLVIAPCDKAIPG